MQINSYEGSCKFMNKFTREYLGFSLEELNLLGSRYITQDIFHQGEVEQLVGAIKNFHHQNNMNERLTFFQRIKPRKKKFYEWVYINSKLIETPDSIYNDRLLVTCPVSEMAGYSRQISKVLDENQYFKRYFKRYCCLTSREKEIIPLVATGFKNAEIAEALFISKETVNQHRKNINSKLEFKTYYELIKFAETFELL
ncbi:MAG: helix-turn-helix transcriptional regulator [Bacteroidales bacterium]|nr:helix-turn-helix transcriptional regulator [Bacteroidales bacterium]